VLTIIPRQTLPRTVEARTLPIGHGLLTAKQVAVSLGIRPKRVYELVGHLAISLSPRTLRWEASDIEAFIETRRVRIT
jgi:predicted DNA-binding transcriptional regulator AlpA